MTLVIPDWIATNAAWGTVMSLGIGYGAYLLKRKGRQKKSDEGETVQLRRCDDAIISQFLNAYKQGVEMGGKIADEIRSLAEALRAQNAAQNEGFRDIHRKLDHALKAAGHARPGQ